MFLEIEILSGARLGTVIKLASTSKTNSVHPHVLEDEALKIRVILDEYYELLCIILNDAEIPYTHAQEVNSKWEYSWYPQRLPKYGYEAFFQNYYGFAELFLGTSDLSLGIITNIVKFQKIEVLAKKITADRIDKMLSFLATNDSKEIAAFFRATRVKAGLKDGKKTVNFLIEQIERNLELLSSELPKIFACPIAKLVPERKIIFTSTSSSIDETTLAWLSENADSLYPDENQETALISYEGNLFASSKVLENHLTNDIDIYENQVIHGFIFSLIRAVSEMLSGLEVPEILPPDPQKEGYVSLFSQLTNFSKKINKTKTARLKNLINELQHIKITLEQRLPVSRKIIGTPKFTKKARYNIHYQRIYHKIISWHRFGAPDWSVQEELFSIQSVPKLFEYYVLFLTKYHLEKKSPRENDLSIISHQPIDQNKFIYQWGDFTVSLEYELKSWTPDHNNVEESLLTNTEAWYVNKKSWSIHSRGSKNKNNSNRCPDFTICLSDRSGNSRYFIIDAKYTTKEKAFIHYLPELTMKYIHGLHDRQDGASPIDGLMIVNPSSTCQTKHFHHPDYSIYGSKPVRPALLVSSVAPGAAEGSDSDYGSNLRKALIFLAKDLTAK